MGTTSNCSNFGTNTPSSQNNSASSVKFQVEALEKPFPIYSSVVKKKSNPARDFALTVLENDKKAVKTKETCDLNEISQLLTTTNQLLTRNSHLRASLTIRVQRSNSKKDSTKTVFVLPKTENLVDVIIDAATASSSSAASEANIAGLQKQSKQNSAECTSECQQLRKDSTSGDSGNASGENTSGKCSETDTASEEESCSGSESTLPRYFIKG